MSYTNDSLPSASTYTNDTEQASSNLLAGEPIGLLLSLTYPAGLPNVYTNDTKPS